MDYHQDRFEDFSLIIEDRYQNIIALFPACVSDNTISSHAGLTFGGLLYKPKSFVKKIITILTQIEQFYVSKGIQKMIYKVMPYIYKSEQGEEDVYALFMNDWKLIRRDFSSIIKKESPYHPDRSRRKNNAIALKNGVEIHSSNDITTFWNLLNENLQKRHKVKPTHSLEELKLLMQRFPNEIKLIGGFKNDQMLGGAILFLTPFVCKIQYSVNSLEGRELKVLDAIFTSIINENSRPYVDFGHSSENDGKYLNEGLSRFKTQFSAEALVCDFYMKDLSSNL